MTFSHRTLLALCLASGVVLPSCTDTQELGDPQATEGGSGDASDDDTDGSLGDVECSDDGCYSTCIRRFSPPGSAGEICTEPAPEHESWACGLQSVCPAFVFELGADPDLDTAACVLSAMRDRTPGAVQFGDGSGMIDVFILGDGTALVDAEGVVASSCAGMQKISSMGAIELREPSDEFWQACLDATTAEDVLACFFTASNPDERWFLAAGMPWQVPACAPAEGSCDG